MTKLKLTYFDFHVGVGNQRDSLFRLAGSLAFRRLFAVSLVQFRNLRRKRVAEVSCFE